MSVLGAFEYRALSLLFDSGYRGYKPNTRELPNGDGKIDSGKRYLHVALKYNPPGWALDILARAHFEACRIAEWIGVPAEFYPRVEDGTLRVLEYPPGEGSAEHTDFDLFTVNLWRSTPEDHEQYESRNVRLDWYAGAQPYHLGEIGELVGLGRAVAHRVQPRSYKQQALVYFAMPSLDAELPLNAARAVGSCDSVTVREWLEERKARSRVSYEDK